MRRALASVLLVAVAATGCTAPGRGPGAGADGAPGAASSPSPGRTDVPDPSPTGAPDVDREAFERELRRTLTVPPMPAFAIPTQLLSTPENQRISAGLDIPPGLYQGIAVVDARCTDAGQAAAADTGSPVAAVAQHFEDESVSVTVGADGTGVYDTDALHVAVLADGAGVYDDGRTRLSVGPDGSGTYSSGDTRFTVRADGSGSYSDGTTRVWVDPSGAGGYEDATTRLSMTSEGEVFGDGDAARVAAVRAVLADGLPLFPAVPRVATAEQTGTVCGTVIRLDANVLFDVDRAEVQPDGQEHLRRVAALLEALGEPRAQVDGHTDSVGDEAYNVDLSERRAAAVRDLLVGFGVDGGSLVTRGLGETRLLRAETGSDGAVDPGARQLNRRVEIVLLDG